MPINSSAARQVPIDRGRLRNSPHRLRPRQPTWQNTVVARNTYYRTPHWRALKQACHDRDGWRCTVPGCTTPTHRLTCDHIKRRPNSDAPTVLDVLSNTRTLCAHHDASIKERADGQRGRGGKLVIKGCDKDGWPIDPVRG